jgi:DNA-directed RNA polymerase subunit RPC12/RpoP
MANTMQKKGYIWLFLSGGFVTASGGVLLVIGIVYSWLGSIFEGLVGFPGIFNGMGIGMAIGGAIILAVGLALLGTGSSKKRKYYYATLPSPEEEKVKRLIQMYPKITMADLAAKAGVPANQIEEMLMKLISNGSIKGHVDPGTGDFISGMIDTSRVRPVDDAVFDCPHCGAVMNSAPVRGTSVRCESCGNLIVVK